MSLREQGTCQSDEQGSKAEIDRWQARRRMLGSTFGPRQPVTGSGSGLAGFEDLVSWPFAFQTVVT